MGVRKPLGNDAERVLAYQLIADGYTEFEQNYKFCTLRKFEIDLAFVKAKCGVEINGGVFSMGAHGHPMGILRDMEKSNLLVLLGWKILRYTPSQVNAGEALEGLKHLLSQNQPGEC